MKQYCTFLAHQWDFMSDTINGNADQWGLNPEVNGGYPFLAWQGYTHEFNYTYPTIECAQKITVFLEPDSADYTLQGTTADPVLSEAYCEIIAIANDFNLSETLTGATFSPGVHSITWTLTDTLGNIAECISEIEINQTVGIQNILQGVRIFPNPAKDVLIIADMKHHTHLKLYDYSGKIVFYEVSDESELKVDLSSYPPGIYLVQLEKNGDIHQEKVIIE